MTAPPITNVVMTSAGTADRSRGLVGFVRLTVAGLVIDGITVRRSTTGELVLGFPRRRDRYGIDHVVVRPADDATRCAITRVVLAALGLSSTADSAPAAQGQTQ